MDETRFQNQRAEVDSRAGAYSVPRWYAAYTCANREKRVSEQLGLRGVQHFLPLYASVRRWKDRRVDVGPAAVSRVRLRADGAAGPVAGATSARSGAVGRVRRNAGRAAGAGDRCAEGKPGERSSGRSRIRS